MQRGYRTVARCALPADMTHADPSLWSVPSGARLIRLVSGPPAFDNAVISIMQHHPHGSRARAEFAAASPDTC